MEISDIWRECRTDAATPKVFRQMVVFGNCRAAFDVLKIINYRREIVCCTEEVRRDFGRFFAEDLRKLNILEQLAREANEIAWLNMLEACSVTRNTRREDISFSRLDGVEIMFDLRAIKINLSDIERLPALPPELSKVGKVFLHLAEDVKKKSSTNRLLVV